MNKLIIIEHTSYNFPGYDYIRGIYFRMHDHIYLVFARLMSHIGNIKHYKDAERERRAKATWGMNKLGFKVEKYPVSMETITIWITK